MDKQQLQRRLWLALRDLGADRHPQARNIIDGLLDAADIYAATREVAFHAALAAADTPGNTRMRRETLAFETGTRRAS